MVLFLGGIDRLAVYGAHDRPQEGVGADHEDGRQQRVEGESFPGEQAHRRRTPERRSGIEASDV